MPNKTGPKAPRNKVERVLLIHGKPDILYKTSAQTYYSVKEADGNITLIGKVGERVVDLLAKIPGAEIIKEIKQEKRTKKPIGYGIKSIQQSGSGDTTVHISAPTEEGLIKRISAFEDFAAENGHDIQERCLWVCKVDNKYAPVQENTSDVQDNAVEVHKKKLPEKSKEKIKATIGNAEFVLEEAPVSFQQLVASKIKEGDVVVAPVVTPIVKTMSERTKSLQQMALKMIGKT